MELHVKDEKESHESFVYDKNKSPGIEKRILERVPFNFEGSLGQSLNISEVYLQI